MDVHQPRVSRRLVLAQCGAVGFTAGLLGRSAANVAAQGATPGPLPPILQTYSDVWNAHDDGTQFANFLTDDVVWEDVTLGLVLNGPEECAGYLVEQYNAIPDVRSENTNGIVADGKGFVEWLYTGTYTGQFPNTPAGQGQALSWRGVDVLEIRGDKLSRITTYYDGYTAYVQLGILPPPGAPATPTA